MRAGAFLLVIGSAVATAAAAAAGPTVIDMPAPRGHSVATVSAGDSQRTDLGAVALRRYAAARTVPLYSSLSVGRYRPYYGFGYGYGYGYGYAYPVGFGHGYGRWYGRGRYPYGGMTTTWSYR